MLCVFTESIFSLLISSLLLPAKHAVDDVGNTAHVVQKLLAKDANSKLFLKPDPEAELEKHS